MKLYVASSWRNERQQTVVGDLRDLGHEVYDFKADAEAVFHWSDIDPTWETWDVSTYLKGLDHPRALRGFGTDWKAMNWADAFLLVMPCGRSAHLELGWAIGKGKPTCILLWPTGCET